MSKETILLSIVFVPLAGAVVLPLLGLVSRGLRNLAALIFAAVPCILSLKLIPLVKTGVVVTVSSAFPLGFNFVLSADCLAVFMAAVSSFISAIIVLYSFNYISHYDNQNEYYSMVSLFLGAMMGLVFSGNLIFLYIFWEVTAIASWRLIGFFREKEHVYRADKAFLITAAGALFMLIGFIALYQQTGSFDLAAIRLALLNNPASGIAVALILFGIFSKSATLPFQTWLPDAGVAPSPVTALLHAAVLVKIGVYVFARLFIATFAIGPFLVNALLWIAAISALVSAGAAFVEKDIKRIIAYSTISQIAFIFLGFAVGNQIGIAGALLFILMHGLAKGGLFLCAGIIEQNTHTKDITKLGGLIKTMPVTAFSFILCAFSIMGIPPFGGFFSKFMVMTAAVQSGRIALALVFLSGAFMTIIYLFRLFNTVFMGEAGQSQAKEGSPLMVLCVLALGILSLLGGIFINLPAQFVQQTVIQMRGFF
jgi:NADH:ubiquinone oxidoreductase subunit 5 (subunit L)/multisubunit Na+/H+ antiporter MnhA subunit